MLLDHLGHPDAANKVEAAVSLDLVSRAAARSTSEIGDAIAGRL